LLPIWSANIGIQSTGLRKYTLSCALLMPQCEMNTAPRQSSKWESWRRLDLTMNLRMLEQRLLGRYPLRQTHVGGHFMFFQQLIQVAGHLFLPDEAVSFWTILELGNNLVQRSGSMWLPSRAHETPARSPSLSKSQSPALEQNLGLKQRTMTTVAMHKHDHSSHLF